jgi:hypothetical protein
MSSLNAGESFAPALYLLLLTEYRNEWNLARMASNNVRTRVANDQIFLTIFHARKHIDTAYAKLQNAETQTGHMELQLQIEERWAIGSEQYTCYKQEASMGKYRAALDELERLVVMRLFELSKMSLSGTGHLSCSCDYPFTDASGGFCRI